MKIKLLKVLVLCLLACTMLFAVSCSSSGSSNATSSSESVEHVCDFSTLKEDGASHWYECACGKIDGEKTPHDFSTGWRYNNEKHYHECSCGAKKDYQAHEWTEESINSSVKECSICGFILSEYKGLEFNTLEATGFNVYGKVANSVTEFSFVNEIKINGDASYVVSSDVYGSQTFLTKIVPLGIGDNVFYVFAMVNNEVVETYTITIRRRPIYTVTFNSNGGSWVESQQIEEEYFAIEPTTQRAGYDFAGWDYDFASPITNNTTINASWRAHTNTKYKVEYYLQNLEDDNYTLDHTDELEGTIDTTANAEIKTFEHFTYNVSKSITSGNVNGDESLVLRVYYTRNKYTLSINNSSAGVLTNAGSYLYGTSEFDTTVSLFLGYEFEGWYSGNVLLSTDLTYTFTADKDVVAKFAVKEEMSYFSFNSTETDCEITRLKESSATEVVMPDYITAIGEMAFRYCESLTNVVIPNSVTSIGYAAFQYCKSLESIEIPDSVTSMGSYVFYSCTSLKSVEMGGSITRIGSEAFYDCGSLTSVVIPDSVINIGDYAFQNCTSLSSVVIGDNVISIGVWAFFNCTSLTSVVMGDRVTSIDAEVFGNCANLQYYEYGNCKYLGTINNPYYALIKVIDKDGTSCTIHNDTVIIASHAFMGCSYIEEMTVPNGVTNIGDYAFSWCSSLTSITIPDSVISIGERAFQYSTSLTSVKIPDSVTNMGDGIFSNCSGLINVVIGDGVTSVGERTFYDCVSLTSVVIGRSVTSIDEYAFYLCTGLTSVVMPNSVTSIGKDAFNWCTSLKSIKYRGTEAEWLAISKYKNWDVYFESGSYKKINYTIIYNYQDE